VVQNVNGVVSGNVTVQRYVAGGSGYRYFSAPISDASIVDINDNVPLVGFPGTSSPGAFPNIYYYDETNTSPDSMQGWTTPTTLAPGYLLGVQKGWAVRMNGNVTVDLTGNLNNGSLNKTVTHTSSGRYTADGWNLVGNPYASPLNWDVVAGSLPSQIDNAIYYWDPIGEQYAAYVNGAGTNGATKEISSMQAFFIKVNTPGSYTLNTNNNARTTGDPIFFRTAPVNNEMLTLTVSGVGHKDQTIVRFADNGTSLFDRTLDAYKRGSSSTAVPSLYTGVYSDSANLQYAVNTLSDLVQEVSVPLSMKSQVAGSYAINADNLSTFDATSFVWLEDVQANKLQDLRQNPVYSFTSNPVDAAARFVLHFTPPVKISTTSSTCDGKDGSITINNPASVVWVCTVNDAQNNFVSLNNNLIGTQTINGLAKGDYTVIMTSNGYTVTKVIHVDGAAPVKALFSTTTTAINTGQQVVFNNQSTGNGQYNWSFGDGQTSTDQTPTHTYQYAGNYDVVLTIDNGQCNDNYSQTLKVSDVVSGIDNNNQQKTTIFANGTTINIEFANIAVSSSVSIDVLDVMGRKVIATQTVDPASGKYSFEVGDIAIVYYFVKLTGKGFDTVQKVFLGENR
jgi:PKD repeat protein